MSIAVMNWVWQHSPTSGNERLVLLALADACSRDDGTGCWPSVGTVARKAKITERSARRVIARLEAAGHLRVTRTDGGGPRSTNTYAVVLRHADPGQNVTPDETSPLTRRAATPDASVPPPLTQASADPPLNQIEPPPGGHAPAPARVREGGETGAAAKALIAAYAAGCAARPPSAVLGQLGWYAAAMLDEGIGPEAIGRALERFRDRPMHPSALPSLVNEELNPPARSEGTRARDRFAGLDQAAAAYATEEVP